MSGAALVTGGSSGIGLAIARMLRDEDFELTLVSRRAERIEAARDGIRTGGDPRNRDFAGPHVSSDGVPDELLALAYDAQTAGGLLVTLPAEKALSLEAEFERAGLFLARVGSVEEGTGVVLEP